MALEPVTTPEHSPPWSTTVKLIIGVILFVLFALAVFAFRKVFTPLIVAAIIAYLVYPLARFVSRLTRLPHGLATLVVYIVLLGTLVPVGIFLAPLLIEQIDDLRNQLIDFILYVQASSADTIEVLPGVELRVEDLVNEVTAALSGLIRAAAAQSVGLLVGVSKTILFVIFTVFIAFYFTADAHQFVEWVKSLGPSSYRPDVEMLLNHINAIWADFFRGQVILAFVVTLIITALSFAIGLPQPLLMGLLAGLLEFLVSVGHTIWLIVALIVALIEGSTYLPVSNVVFALIVIGTNLIFTKFDLNFLIPRIVGARVRLHPVVVIIGIIIGVTIGGVLGIVLAAPTIATLRVIFRYIHAKMFDRDPFPELRPAAPEVGQPRPEARSARLAVSARDAVPAAPADAPEPLLPEGD